MTTVTMTPAKEKKAHYEAVVSLHKEGRHPAAMARALGAIAKFHEDSAYVLTIAQAALRRGK